ncbi:hypothetical protein K458DRAFT_456065 [Lentithecium fluviatile CBS 122367]|uniref:Heterokaryon incompatibility domain-containing protein n=1 Tax=Lentithecium fluviatile CBS 122367 TaxID=1168545 RepID=A0A6G1IVD7_9PLEO|nr:hypothetical protein K458DRAFT_456065 [Lentithecium fluviatile CBS 122367]
MRLIDTTTLELKSFWDPDQPYVILSYTWGPDGEEVTFQEPSRGPSYITDATRSKPGFRKIVKTYERARTQYSLPYAWIDTCFIDKMNSVELGEAINSMYR